MKHYLFNFLSLFQKPIHIVVHNGGFHADDVTAVALLSLYYKKHGKRIRVTRTRDSEIIKNADVVCDVGGVYNPEQNRFDHHQTGGAGFRENGVPYASVGLVWKRIGKELCEPYESLAEKIDRECIQFIDANDNGYDFGQKTENSPLPLPAFFMIYNTTWKERSISCKDNDKKQFMHAVKLAKDFFERYIETSKQSVEASEMIKQVYETSSDKQILIFDTDFTRPVFIAHLLNYPEPLFHIYPDRTGTWSVETVPASFGSFEKRISFPKKWAGLRDKELQNVSGFSELIFCHNSLFLCKVTSKEKALAIARYVRDNKTA
jgi:uncharacterized UPF0160 family protein